MAASPRSSASSDLYPCSEPVQRKTPVPETASPKSAPNIGFVDVQNEVGSLGDSDTMEDFESLGEDVHGAHTVAAGTSTRTLSETSHGRSWKQDAKSEVFGGETMFPRDIENGVSLGNRTDNLESNTGSPFKWHSRNLANSGRTEREHTIPLQGPASTKRMDPTPRMPTLPAAVWQYIFCFVPPVFLGRLLRVNHAFHSYLSPGGSVNDSVIHSSGVLQQLEAGAIWIASRRRFAPGLPKPIHDKEELDMWRLLVGHKCQVCGHDKSPVNARISESPQDNGPGKSGVRVIWPLGIRCCGVCLQDTSYKEMELYISSDCPSFLLQAIPCAFVSKDLEYISHNDIRNHTSPLATGLTKYFHRPAVDAIKREFEEVKVLGAPSAEEWIKGLASRGHKHLEDILRWEQWESKGGLRKVNTRHHTKSGPPGFVAAGKNTINTKDGNRSDSSTPQGFKFPIKSQYVMGNPAPHHPLDSVHHAQSVEISTTHVPWNSIPSYQFGAHQGRQTPNYQPRSDRTIRDVNDAKAARRAEIEHRCQLLDPPLPASVLNHMETFQAALQITQPMTDTAWNVLKPRLLAQVPYAEQKEKERMQQEELVAEESRQKRQQEAQLKETKETLDREWETFQNPVRNRLGALADEIIESRWDGGRSVTKETSPQFAADMLVNVRQRFYAAIAQEDEAAVAAGQPVKSNMTNGPPTRTLILENMKWVYDTKIKPLTDHLQRELFLCNGCDGNFKFYGFEGVIQHYAAKHTTTLSLGNIVVHWRAEWPQHSPFNPDPSTAKSAYYSVPTPAKTAYNGSTQNMQETLTWDALVDNEGSGTPAAIRQQDSLQPANDSHSVSLNRPQEDGTPPIVSTQPYPPPATYNTGTTYGGGSNEHARHAGSYMPYRIAQHGPPIYESHTNQQPSILPLHNQPSINQGYSQAYISNAYAGGPQLPPAYAFQGGPQVAHPLNAGPPFFDLYQRQMEEMAKHAKDIFTNIGGVKDLPGSVRIYVVIQLTVSRFKATFSNEPSLTMFIDGLDHNSTMRPVRSVNGLGCKTCMNTGTGAKLFTLPHLVNHFKTVHVESPQILSHPPFPEMDWKQDMIDLPDASIISKLTHAAGMTDSKLRLIAAVFSHLFPKPLPSLRSRVNTGLVPSVKNEANLNPKITIGMGKQSTIGPFTYGEGLPRAINYGHTIGDIRPLSQEPPSEPLDAPGEDEYDPHRPAYLDKIIKIDSVPPLGSRNGLQTSFGPTSKPISRDLQQQVEDGNGCNTSKEIMGTISRSHLGLISGRKESSNYAHSPLHLGDRSSFQAQAAAMGLQRRSQFVEDFPRTTPYSHSYQKFPGIESNNAAPEFITHEKRNMSSPLAEDDATKFLNGLAPKLEARYAHEPFQSEAEIDHRWEASWQGDPHAKRRKIRSGSRNGHIDRRLGDPNAMNPQYDEQVALREPRRDDFADDFPRTVSRAGFYEDFRPSSRTFTSTKSRMTNGVPVAPVNTQQHNLQTRQEMNDHLFQRPHSVSHNFSKTRPPRRLDSSASPKQIPDDKALYRPRSPIEEDRGDTSYRPSPFSPQQNHYPRIVSYDHAPAARCEYVDDRSFREAQYIPAVKYVHMPIEYEDSRLRGPATRYIVSSSTERIEPEYVRYEQYSSSEPFYGRDDQVYRSPQKTYHKEPSRTPPEVARHYEY